MTIFVPEFGFSSGTETVLLKVLPRLVSSGHAVVLAAPAYRLRRYDERGLDQRVRRVELAWPSRGWRKILHSITRRGGPEKITRFLWQICLRDLVRRENATHVFVPWIVDQPVVKFGRPTAVMVMDLAWRHYPSTWFGKSPAQLDASLKHWLNHARLIFPVSDSTADELRRSFPETTGRLVSVPHGSEWKGGGIAAPGDTTDSPPFFLTPASLTPNKNHALLLDAAIQLWREGQNFRLVWTGNDTAGLSSEKDSPQPEIRNLQNTIREHAGIINKRLESRGFVSDDILASLYKKTRRVVLPSTYEGFGLPVLEAYERGSKVICTDIPPFREQMQRYLMQDHTTLIPDGDAQALTRALRTALLEEQSPTPEAPADLRQRLESWTWDDAVRRYAEELGSL